MSGAQYLQRASDYYHVGERFLQPKSKAGNDAYMRGVDACATPPNYQAAEPRARRIPYDGKSLPAIYVHAEPVKSGGKVPAMVFFDGLDVTKEIQYFKGVADLAARGIACLIVDGPGNGESIRFRDLYLRHDTEHYATPAYEYLAAGRRSIRNASASWRSASAATMRRARRRWSPALPAASPGARSGIIRSLAGPLRPARPRGHPLPLGRGAAHLLWCSSRARGRRDQAARSRSSSTEWCRRCAARS